MGKSILDILIGILLLLFFFHGMRRGLVRALFSLASLVAGWIVASRFHLAIANRFNEIAGEEVLVLRAGVFLILFLITVLLVRGVGNTMHRVVTDTPLGFLNRIAGGACGLLVGMFFLGVIVLLIITYLPAGRGVLNDSELVRPLTGVVRGMSRMFPDEARDLFEEHLRGEGDRPAPEQLDEYI